MNWNVLKIRRLQVFEEVVRGVRQGDTEAPAVGDALPK